MKLLRWILAVILAWFLQGCGLEDPLIWKSIDVCHYHQGDAHLIMRGKYAYLIDTGEASQTKKFLLPVLRKSNIDSIEIIVSHPHFDHYGGIVPILQSDIVVRKIYMNLPTKAQMDRERWGGSYKDIVRIIKTALQKNIPIVPIRQGDIFPLGRHSYMEVLSVYDGIHTPVGPTDINDMSVVMMLHHYDHRFLLTGDLNQKIGLFLAKSNPALLRADILKAPHHGAESMAPDLFFHAVSPKQIIVTAPKHLWNDRRTQRLKNLALEMGSKVYVNGMHGTITVISRKSHYKIQIERGFIFLPML